MKERYRVGIVGSGFGVLAHLPALLAHPRFDVVALASPNRAAQVAQERGIPHAFAGCDEMLAALSRDGLDGVVVAAPPFTHRDDVLAALDAGMHVMCEKPFALSIEQAEEMVAAGRNAGTACGVAHEFRWVPQRIALKQMIENGHLAPMREIEYTHLVHGRRLADQRARCWLFERSRGGGISGALMSHAIDGVNHLVGRAPKRATGYTRIANPSRTDTQGAFSSDTDDGAFALLDYGDGLIARLTTDATTNVEQFTLAVHGEGRTAVASGSDLITMQLFAIQDDETDELEVKASPYRKLESVGTNVPLLMELYDEWVTQIETGTSALPTFDEALATQRILAEIGYST